MKKFFLSLLLLLGVSGILNAQNTYKVIEVYKDGQVTHTLKISDIDSLAVKSVVTGGVINGHEYIDLGLPSGTLWATCNVGATLPADYGDYFAWGETRPKTTYDLENYKWYNNSTARFTKYHRGGYDYDGDNLTVLEPKDDAATATWGTAWRMPTLKEIEELCEKCTWTSTTKIDSKGDEIVGYEVTSKSNGNSIFLPDAGYYDGMFLQREGAQSYYWSSTLHSHNSYNAYYMTNGHSDWYSRTCGRSVRPVRALSQE